MISAGFLATAILKKVGVKRDHKSQLDYDYERQTLKLTFLGVLANELGKRFGKINQRKEGNSLKSEYEERKVKHIRTL